MKSSYVCFPFFYGPNETVISYIKEDNDNSVGKLVDSYIYRSTY